VSLQNVLLKVFDGGAVLVKLSDFGLGKDRTSEYTRTQTEMGGTIRDPMLSSFSDYGVTDEIYALGWVDSYIFTGREALTSGTDPVSQIVGSARPTTQARAMSGSSTSSRTSNGWRRRRPTLPPDPPTATSASCISAQ
jgi:hypothetical protein